MYKLLGQPSRTLSQETIPSTTKGWATLCLTSNAGESNPYTTTTGSISEFTTEFPSHRQSQQQNAVLLEFGQQVSPCRSHPATVRTISAQSSATHPHKRSANNIIRAVLCVAQPQESWSSSVGQERYKMERKAAPYVYTQSIVDAHPEQQWILVVRVLFLFERPILSAVGQWIECLEDGRKGHCSDLSSTVGFFQTRALTQQWIHCEKDTLNYFLTGPWTPGLTR